MEFFAYLDLADLYGAKNISRTTYTNVLGYNWLDETDLMEQEQAVLKEKELGEFAPLPNGVQPTPPPGQDNTKPSDINKTSKNKDGQN